MRVLAVKLLLDGLLHRHGEDPPLVILAQFHLVEQPGMFLEHLRLQVLRREVLQSQRDFLLIVILIVVVRLQVSVLLGCDDLPHQFHGRVILTAVSRRAFFADGHLIQFLRVRFQPDHKMVGSR